MKLQTNRLLLRNLKTGDLKDFLEYRSDPEVCVFQSYQPFTQDRAEKYIENLKDGEFGEAGKWVQLGIELKSENKLIGDIGLKPEAYDARIVEFGVSLSNQYQKNGFAGEALIRVFDYLFHEVGIHRLSGIVDVENVGCIHLLENLNFRREAAYVESFWNGEMWRDEFLYAMLENDWKTNMK